MTKRSYWTGRYTELTAANQQQSAQYEQRFGIQSDVLYMQMQAELENWYSRYGRTAGVSTDDAAEILKNARSQQWDMTLNQYEKLARQGGHDDELDLAYIKSRVARMQQLQEQLKNQAAHAVPSFDAGMQKELEAGYKRTYEHATYLNEQQGAISTKANFAHYDEAALESVLKKPWAQDGKNFSQRIWGNMQGKLPDMLMEQLAESIVLGHSSAELVNKLSMKYGDFKRSDLHRLIQTEMAHVEENATFDSYDDCDVDYYVYMATLESHTCDVCRSLDGRKFKTADKSEGLNYPPIHPYCRCTTGAWFPQMPDVGKRWARDPETNKREMVDGQTFNQWWANKIGASIIPPMPARPAVKPEPKQPVNGEKSWDELYGDAKKFTSVKDADKVLRPELEHVWKELSQPQRNALYDYTEYSDLFNNPLRGYAYVVDPTYGFKDAVYKGVGKVDLNGGGKGEEIKLATEALNKSKMPANMITYRRSDEGGLEGLLGLKEGKLSQLDADAVSHMVGKTYNEYGFFSTSANKWGDISEKGVGYEVYVPKGAHASYCEPFSRYSSDTTIPGAKWDGKTVQDRLLDNAENEVLLNRNTKFKVHDITKDNNGKYLVKLEVILDDK